MMMDSSSAQDQLQEIGSQTLESMLGCTIPGQQQEKKPRPSDQQSLKCPRCDSANTKFCYYNNYSLSQPRYFCKSCRRYWTKGGTLRNVPVGGGCRKNKRSSSSSSISSSSSLSSSKKSQDPIVATVNNIPSYDSNDLTLAIARLQNHGGHDHHFSILGNHHPNMTHQQSHHHHVMGGTSSGYFLENHSSGGFQNMYYGNNGSLGMELSGVNNQDLGIMGFDNHQEFNNGVTSSAISTAVTTVKQENIIRGDGDQNGGFWSFPWKNFDGNGGGNNINSNSNIGEMDSGRVNWNGIGLSNWQGLLNSPLM